MAIGAPPRLLGEILVAEGLTTADAVDRALARQRTTGELIGEALAALGAVNEDDVARALAVQQDLPYVWREELPSTVPVLKNVSPKYLRQYRICPITIEGGVLTVASADPLNTIVADDLRQATGLTIKFVVSSATGILETIDRNYDGANASALQRIVEGIDEERAPDGDEDVNHLRDMAFEAPVVRLVNLLIENAITAEASDIHIEPFEDTLRIRYRIDGILYDQEAPPRRLQAAVTSRIKIMAEMNIAERRLPQDGRIRVNLHGARVDIRVSTIPTVHGESIVMRLLQRSSVFLPLDKLGFPADTLKRFDALIKRPHGIILVTGPTGSGKTTTLYGALDKINSPERKIITVEDPVEYQLKGVNQIAVKPKIGLSFATGLRHIVRQDPDVILVGEIRDLETAELAQRLVRRVCAACRVPDTPSAADLDALGVVAPDNTQLLRGKGCDECRGTGYRGRMGIYELFPITEDARSLMLRRSSSRDIRQHAIAAGMITLRMDGWRRACEGLTTVEEILRVTQEDA